MVERHVQTIKNILKKTKETKTDQQRALLSLRNTPISGMHVSPSQLLFSRRLRDALPIVTRKLKPEVIRDAKERLTQCQQKTKVFHDARHSTQHQLLVPDTPVRFRINNSWRQGKIKSVNNPRRYTIVTADGHEFIRNRRFIFPTKEYFSGNLHWAQIPTQRTSEDNQMTPDVEGSIVPPDCDEAPAISVTEPPVPGCSRETRHGRQIRPPKRYGFD